MTKISPNLRTHSRIYTLLGRKIPDVNLNSTLLSLPSEVLTVFLTYLSTADLLNFTNTCSRLRILRTAKTCNKILTYLRSRRKDQENLLSSPSPDRLSVGPLRELNTPSQSDSPSPKYAYKTPISVVAGSQRRSSSSFSSPAIAEKDISQTSKTPLSSKEKKSKRRLKRL